MTKLKDSELLGFTQIRTPFASQGIEKCQIKGCKMLIPLIATTTQTTHYAQRVNRLIQYGLTSHSTQYKSFWGRYFYGPDDRTSSIKALKEVG